MAQAAQQEYAGDNSSATPSAQRSGFMPEPSSGGPDQALRASQAWLNWQCKMIAGVRSGAVFEIAEGQLKAVRAKWPSDQKPDPDLAMLARQSLAAENVVMESQKTKSSSASELLDSIAVPVNASSSRYIVTMRMASRSQSQQQAVVQLLQWGGLWLGSLDELFPGIEPGGIGSGSSQSLYDRILGHDSMHAACMELANTLAGEFSCERVSVGLKHGFGSKIQAVSQLSDFDRRRHLMRAIEGAMTEAADQGISLSLPVDTESDLSEVGIQSATTASSMPVLNAHNSLQSLNGNLAIYTMLLVSNGSVVGAAVLEREIEKPFGRLVQERCSHLLRDIGPILDLKARSERSIAGTLRDSLRRRWNSLRESGKARWVVAGSAVAALMIAFFPVEHRVVATASVESSDQQLLVAPQAGYVNSASRRAGDTVKAGEVIATLDNRDLIIERNKWQGELNKLETSYAQALGTRNRAEVGLLQAKKQQIKAELSLLDQKLDRSVLKAPFDGILVSGDLNQSLGAPVDAGETLFEIASMESYRLILEIDEHDVAGITAQQNGKLRISALPGRTYETTIKSVIPVAVTRNKNSVFRVEATLDETSDVLRPGMRGVARIETGRKSLLWIWSHKILNRLRLWLWSSGL